MNTEYSVQIAALGVFKGIWRLSKGPWARNFREINFRSIAFFLKMICLGTPTCLHNSSSLTIGALLRFFSVPFQLEATPHQITRVEINQLRFVDMVFESLDSLPRLGQHWGITYALKLQCGIRHPIFFTWDGTLGWFPLVPFTFFTSWKVSFLNIFLVYHWSQILFLGQLPKILTVLVINCWMTHYLKTTNSIISQG